MSAAHLEIVIAGAGIAGLTTALSLARHGIPARIFERAERLEEVGAGLQLSPNATRILARLGLLRDLQDVAVEPAAVTIREARRLRRIASVPLGASAQRRWGAPYLVLHRAELQAVLLDHVRKQPLIALSPGTEISRFSAQPERPRLRIATTDGRDDIRADLLIGADGVRSRLRGLIPGGAVSRDSGDVAWRRTVGSDRIAACGLGAILPDDQVTTLVDPRFHLVAYPLRGGRDFNLVAVARAQPESSATPAPHSFANAASALRGLLEEQNQWQPWPIHTVAPDGAWTDPRGAVLVGDAAHAMTPYAAQGAAMAIEDAAALADALHRADGDLPSAFAAYELERRDRIGKVARRGAFNHFAWHAWGPVALARNLVLASRSGDRLAADLDWLYGE